MIKNIEVQSTPLSVKLTPVIKTDAFSSLDKTASVFATSSDATTVSVLSRQLSESAVRAEFRDKTLTRSELGDLALKLQRQFDSEPYARSNAREVMLDSTLTDRALIERDRQAVAYIIRDMQGDSGVRNPFPGLSYEQLTLIAYDEGDAFTLNERHAAYRGAWNIEFAWRMKMGTQSQQGSFSQEPHVFFAEHLIHYRSLPLIEQAQYTEGYEADTESLMIEAANSPGHKPSDELLTLFDLIAGKVKKDPSQKQIPGIPPAVEPVIKTSSLSPDVSPNLVDVARS